MAHDGSFSAMAVNSFTVSGKKNECSIATARLNCCCAAGLQEIGKLTSPNRSSLARAAPWLSNTTNVDRSRNPAIRKFAMTDPPPRFSIFETIPNLYPCVQFIYGLDYDDKSECIFMNLRFLRTFVEIADYAGFARAATRLNLTQSAASRQI